MTYIPAALWIDSGDQTTTKKLNSFNKTYLNKAFFIENIYAFLSAFYAISHERLSNSFTRDTTEKKRDQAKKSCRLVVHFISSALPQSVLTMIPNEESDRSKRAKQLKDTKKQINQHHYRCRSTKKTVRDLPENIFDGGRR